MKRVVLAATVALVGFADTPPPSGYYDSHHLVWYDKYDRQGSPWLWGSVDKREHFAMGAIVGSWAALEAEHLGWRHPWVWGFAAGLTVGLVKEVCDYKRWGFFPVRQHGGSGTAEIMDAVWTGVGGAAGAVLTIKVRWGLGTKAMVRVQPMICHVPRMEMTPCHEVVP